MLKKLSICIFISVLSFFFAGSITTKAQNIFQDDDYIQKFIQPESRYMKIHDDYKKSLDPLSFLNNNSQRNTQYDEMFLLDTVYIHSISVNPQRYIYTYSTEGYRISSLLQIVKSDNWVNSVVEICTYDSVGNKLTSYWKAWKNGDWVNAAMGIYTYTTNRKMLTSLWKVWKNGDWENTDKGLYTYDIDGNLLNYYERTWKNGEWVNFSNEIYTYDTAGNMLTAFGELWADSIWVNDQKFLYSYNIYGKILTGISENWINSNWIYSYRETYTYDSVNNNKLSFLGELWADSIWVNNQNYIYTYNNLDYLIMSVGKIWADSIWVNYEKGEYIYDTYGGVETSLMKIWINGEWVNSTLTQNNYDDFGNLIVGQYYNWDEDTWMQNQDGLLQLFYNYSTLCEYYTGYQVEASYSSCTVDVSELQNEENISSYLCKPNPAYLSTVLSFRLMDELSVDINLMSITGQKIQSIYKGALTKGKHSFVIKTGHLPSGIYFASLSAGSYMKSFKIIIAN